MCFLRWICYWNNFRSFFAGNSPFCEHSSRGFSCVICKRLLRWRWWLPWIPHGDVWLLPQPPQPTFFWLNHFVAVHTSSWWTFCWATWESERCCARRPIKNGTGAPGHHRCTSRRLFRSSMHSGNPTIDVISHCMIIFFPTVYGKNWSSQNDIREFSFEPGRIGFVAAGSGRLPKNPLFSWESTDLSGAGWKGARLSIWI